MGRPWLGRKDLTNAQGCPQQLAELLKGHRLLAGTTMRSALFENAEETGISSIRTRSRQANSIELPRDMFKSSDSSTELLATSGPMSVTTSACFGEPGAYYVVACAREGVPPGGAASVHRPTCQMPPCAGSVGPPFSMCLGIAAACISTCESGATEVIPQRQFLNGQEPRCANVKGDYAIANSQTDLPAAWAARLDRAPSQSQG